MSVRASDHDIHKVHLSLSDRENGTELIFFSFSADDPCELPVSPGPCQEYKPSWGFDANLNGCREFAYGGCWGNINRFA